MKPISTETTQVLQIQIHLWLFARKIVNQQLANSNLVNPMISLTLFIYALLTFCSSTTSDFRSFKLAFCPTKKKF